MYKIVSALLLMSTLVAPALCQRKAARKTPKRVYTLKSENPRTSDLLSAALAGPKSGLTIEKHVSSYNINSDGTGKQIWEMQQKCSSEICLAQVKNVKHIFNGDLQNMKLLEASVLKPNGKRIDLPVTAGKSLPTPQSESAPGFSSTKQFEIEFPSDAAVGDSLYFRIELETTKPIFGKNFDAIEYFPLVYDWRSIEINVTAPSDYPLTFDATGLQGGTIAADGNRSRWQWKASDLKAFAGETATFDPIGSSPRFAVTSFKSFEELGQAFGGGVREKAVITPEVQKLADEITANLKTPDEQAAAIYQWVNKNIRYLLVVLGRGGWVPHSTTEILQNRYGDCKDYTTLIHALLKAKGIESTPVLINADFGNWFPKVAASGYFNHAILYVPGAKLFADATSPNTRLGIIPQTLVGKTALLSAEKSGLIEVPKNIPDDNQVLSDVEVEFTENGDLKAVSKNTYKGRSEMLIRPLLGGGMRYAGTETLVKLALAFYGINGTGRVLSVSDPHRVGEPFTLAMEVSVPDFTTFLPKGSIAVPVGINLSGISALELFTKDEKRTTDLIVGAARMRESYKLKLPAKAIFGELPAPVKVSNDAGYFTSIYKPVEGGVELVRELVIAKDSYTPAEYPQFKELIRQTVEGLNSSVAYTSDPTLLRAKSVAVKSKSPAKSIENGLDAIYSALFTGEEKKLLPAEVRRLDARIVGDPNDADARLRLLRHYMRMDVKETPAVIKARTAHRLWFIRNQPEGDNLLIYDMYGRDIKGSAEYTALRDEWLKQLAGRKTSKAVRLNVVKFVLANDRDLAKQTLKDGMAIDAEVYEYPFLLTRMIASEIEDRENKLSAEDKAKLKRESHEYGRTALILVKKERSDMRDADRAELLFNLCEIAVETGDMQLAESLGRELVLDFGNEIADSSYSQASHLGNVTLGTVELSRGNTAKAIEHLLASIRAPLRKDIGYFSSLDFRLAKALFKQGESKAVIEFLKLCLELDVFKSEPDVYAVKIKSIREWLAQAEKGVEPSFDFEKTATASKIPPTRAK